MQWYDCHPTTFRQRRGSHRTARKSSTAPTTMPLPAPEATCRLYGIKNCDTMKKTFAWLDEHHIAYTFHDYRKSAVATETLARWCERLGWQTLVNTRGTTWRKLDPVQQAISSADDAIALMASHTSVIRRPVIETAAGELVAGFDPDRLAALFDTTGARE